MQSENIRLVNKEDLHLFHFYSYEVLESETEIESRNQVLQEAALLGNSEKQKVKMTFQTEEGPVRVETTIWDVTDSFIELKGTVMVPICCISEVII